MYKLMVVDDSNIIRNKISRCEMEGQFEVVATAADGEEAVRRCKAYLPDVITMDLTMPRMEGLECIKKIMAFDSEIRILVVSALSDKATGIKALELGACGFLCKPFTEEALVDALYELVED